MGEISQDQMAKLIELSRRVKTPAGAARYDKPVGAVISEGGDLGNDVAKRTPTTYRIMTLQRQILAASRMNNSSLLKSLRQDFQESVFRFSKTHSSDQVLELLDQLDNSVA